MKIRALTLAGFGPYRHEQRVDFTHFDDAGLFLITGKTGAGKSSILDAICFALYGSIPRFDGTQAQLRSDHCEPEDPSFVELEFTVGGVDYTVRRVPEYLRPKKNGSGTTKQAHDASLSRAGEVIAAKPVDVAHELAEIVSLTKDQFLQVVLLAQNRFQQFLLAKNDDRQSVLRTLFGSERFEKIEVALDERRKTVQAELATADGALDQQVEHAVRLLELDEAPTAPDSEWFAGALADLAVRLVAATRESDAADEQFAVADLEHRALLDLAALQRRRDTAATTIAALDDGATEVAGHRLELDAARRAAPVAPLIDARDRAQTALDRATDRASRARAVYEPDGTPLDEAVEAYAATLGTLADVLAEENTLPALDGRISELAASSDTAAVALAAAIERSAALPAELDELGQRATHAASRAARSADAADTVSRTTTALKSAQQAAELEPLLELHRLAEREASSAHTRAAVDLDDLLERRLGGFAGELAENLVAGEPCAVCGSTSHPRPAEHSETPVTADDIDAARDRLAAARTAMDDAHSTANETASRLTDARARADGRNVDELDEALAAASEALRGARSAVDELAAIEAERTRVRGEIEALDAQLDHLRENQRAVASSLTETTSRRDAILARTTKHRGDAESVSARVAELETRLAAARALLAAEADAANKAEALEHASAALAAQLEEQAFDGVDAANEARRDPAEIARLETRIREHDEARATAQATLDEPGIAAAPDGPVAVDPARAAKEAAFEARDRARDTTAVLSRRVTQFEQLVVAVSAQRDATAQRRLEFEQLRQLASVVRGEEPNTRRMRLETYVLAAQLEQIVTAANSRLRTMSAGRYTLEHDDALQYRNTKSGLGLAIRDEHTGRTRATHSLSGGETFLASLALALGLAEVVTNQTGAITLDTLFIDEGFGSLDGETLEIAMSTLDGLREGGRTIGLISHVEAMKEQIPAKLRITVSPTGDSSIAESYEAG
ncbi:SMC family ATPase [Conyzicola nivalis]|uniref:Nuclease SbcCD subunit C n=1 Tax=Conyzicola nivalis TaxID=1477021 RepID=A0A916SEG1_9MICO|nr:SMC family ATPase [Conyzicola nivalis]GGA95234.1 nuclease SbcCD subunit C [Conyzicola nivalis]